MSEVSLQDIFSGSIMQQRRMGKTKLQDEYYEKKKKLLGYLKGGKEKRMETKSRYEVMADLEKQKRDLIREREGFPDQIKEDEFEIKQIKRNLEDKEEALEDYKKSVKERKDTIKELIKGVDQSLERFNKLQVKK